MYKAIESFMGQFKIEVVAVGGHGQDREVKEGGRVNFSQGGEQTPDALAKKLVDDLTAKGCSVESATITHWPGQESEVKDDLVTGMRTGNF